MNTNLIYFIRRVIKFSVHISVPLIVLGLLSTLPLLRYDYTPNVKNKHLFMGNSTVECAINDSIIPNSLNISKSGRNYIIVYSMLLDILKNEENRPHTVYLTTPLISFVNFNADNLFDYVLADATKYYLLKSFPYLYEDLILNSDFYFNILRYGNHAYNSLFSPSKDIGGYLYLERDKLQVDIESYEIELLQNNGSKMGESLEQILEIAPMQVKYFYKTVSLLQQEKINFVLINPPSYKIEKYYSMKGYLSLLSVLDKNIRISDYSDFEIPKEYYGDIWHLNHMGATYFSKYLKEKGIKTESLGEYITRKNNGI